MLAVILSDLNCRICGSIRIVLFRMELSRRGKGAGRDQEPEAIFTSLRLIVNYYY